MGFGPVRSDVIGQAQRPQGQADARIALALGNMHQFQATPAKVCDDAARAGKRAQHAHGTDPRLFLSGKQARLQPQRSDRIEKFGPVARLARSGGGHHVDDIDFKIAQQQRISAQAAHGQIDCVIGQPPGIRNLAAQPCDDFFVEQSNRCARRASV